MHNHPRSANPVPALFNTPPAAPASFDHSTLLSILAGDSTAVDRKRSATSCSRPPRQLLPSALTHFRVRNLLTLTGTSTTTTASMASSQTAASRTATPVGGSRTIEIRPQPVLRLSAPSGVLRLRAEPAEQRRIQWAEDVIDNEGMGKKSSKGASIGWLSVASNSQTDCSPQVCCIYHKPRAADESSDDDSSDNSSSDSDSDSEPDNSTARPAGRSGDYRGRPAHSHGHGDCGGGHDHGGESSGKPQKRARQRRRPSPNAYEKMPKTKK
ncbi:hypothetical protein J1614_004211 [Plenodomus biglobosus]|nr:hypothetical protein J1614_004211 [Plenodomus biglobosus]